MTELQQIEQDMSAQLDDESIPLLEMVHLCNLISADEWNQVKAYLKEALLFLNSPNKTVTHDTPGTLVINPDADPRNADWLRIATANRLAGYSLPTWAALWLWRLKTDRSRKFWCEVGNIAAGLGYPPCESGRATPPQKTAAITPGFVRCEVCGEFNGSTSWENLDWYVTEGFEPGEMVSVSCLCQGIPCRVCHTNKINRPGSNSYNETTNHIEHWPGFTAQMPCSQCRQKKARLSESVV